MKLSLTLLLLFGFIAFIGAAPTEDASVETDPKEEDVPEVPALDDEDNELKDDENDEEAPMTTVAEKDENEDEESDEEENDVAEDPKRRHHHHKGRCFLRGFKRKVFCKRKFGRRVCYSCCHKCIIHRHRCKNTYGKKVCFHYLHRFYKGHRHLYHHCYRAQHSCAIYGRCWSRRCYPWRLRRRAPKKG